jgi:hypothetical protein
MAGCRTANKWAAACILAAALLHVAGAQSGGYVQGYDEGEHLDIYVYASTKGDPYLRQGILFNETASPGALIYRNSTTFGWNVVTGL